MLTNAALLLAGTTAAINHKVLLDSQRWRGWSLDERMSSFVRNFGSDIWNYYCTSLVTHPVLVPAVITGITYCLADWVRARAASSLLLSSLTPRLAIRGFRTAASLSRVRRVPP